MTDRIRRPTPDTVTFFAGVSQALMEDHDEAATVQRVCDLALEVIPSADFAAITVRQRRGRLRTVAHTDEVALECDALQYEFGEGPCMDSALEDEPFLIRSTGGDVRWPRWGPAAAQLGVHSLISVQLSAATLGQNQDPLGAVNLYARQVDAFGTEEMQRALVYAVHAANAMAAARVATSLREAVEGRHHIGVAQGILMQRYGISTEEAFEVLQRYSSHANLKVREVATVVIRAGELPADYEVSAPSA